MWIHTPWNGRSITKIIRRHASTQYENECKNDYINRIDWLGMTGYLFHSRFIETATSKTLLGWHRRDTFIREEAEYNTPKFIFIKRFCDKSEQIQQSLLISFSAFYSSKKSSFPIVLLAIDNIQPTSAIFLPCLCYICSLLKRYICMVFVYYLSSWLYFLVLFFWDRVTQASLELTAGASAGLKPVILMFHPPKIWDS